MEETDDNEKRLNLAELTTVDLLQLCGAMSYTDAQVKSVLERHHTRAEALIIITRVHTPGTKEHDAYMTGSAEDELAIFAELQYNAGRNKESYEAFTSECRRRAINKVLEEKFGLDVE
jgi:hypothetical protein